MADWPRALEACQDAIKDNSADPRLQFLLARAHDGSKGYVEAARHYQIAADVNYAPAENALGLLFVLGRGVVKDYQRAFDLFNKGAIAGDGQAMGNLGSMYSNGYFVKEDDAQALAWYEKAIEAGNSFGLAQAGVMYFNGKGAPRDYDAAAQYFQQAADLGDGYSLKFLAIMYERGLLGKPDPAKASELRLRSIRIARIRSSRRQRPTRRYAAPAPVM
ncbi:MAG TPA: tetratricopeptide repeat protein [Roseiarcus sp.]|nr:tetratricopeptide repeat protein [Roseiarcus sp.]